MLLRLIAIDYGVDILLKGMWHYIKPSIYAYNLCFILAFGTLDRATLNIDIY